MLVNHRRGLGAAAALLAGAAAIGLLLALPATKGGVQAVDDAVWRLVGHLQNPAVTAVGKAFAFVGSVWVNWPLRVAAAVLLAVRRRWIQLLAFALAVLTSELLIGPVKAAYARPRPPGDLISTTGYAFPSGHAIAGAVTAVGLVLVLLPPGRSRWRWEVYAVIFSFLMALSRVYLRAHWLSDTVAGGLLGAGLALGWPALLMSARAGVQRRRTPPAVTGDEQVAGRPG
ncbi:MAG: phosphatase PAP2 family protein [Actinomycetota bacterium]|nr:phosphatase PAP2 family protein [Actinomycetota bacterium]